MQSSLKYWHSHTTIVNPYRAPRDVRILRPPTNATIHDAEKLASLGFEGAMTAIPELQTGVNTHGGHVTHEAVAMPHGMNYSPYTPQLKDTCRT
jgi:alanine dehydrogenase